MVIDQPVNKVSAFDKALLFVFDMEKGLVNDPDDPGGMTNFGITLKTLKDGKYDIDGNGKIDIIDIRKLEPDHRFEIYRDRFWIPLKCDELDWPLAMAAFDTAVNVGLYRTKRWLKLTQERGEGYRYLLTLRTIHYLKIVQDEPSLAKFKKGWLRRVNELKKYIEIEKDDQLYG